MVTITKIGSSTIPHPNKIEDGSVRTGHMKEYPKVGHPFILIKGMGGFFKTSPVVEILQSHLDMIEFKTENSTYRLDIE